MYKFAGRVLNGEGFFVFVRVALRAPRAALGPPALVFYTDRHVRARIYESDKSHNLREKVAPSAPPRRDTAVRGRTRHSVYTVCFLSTPG